MKPQISYYVISISPILMIISIISLGKFSRTRNSVEVSQRVEIDYVVRPYTIAYSATVVVIFDEPYSCS